MRTETPAPERASTLQGLTCLICQASPAPALRSDAGKRSERHEDTAKRSFLRARQPAIRSRYNDRKRPAIPPLSNWS